MLEHVETIEVDFNFEADLSKYKSNQKALTNISGEIQKYLTKRALSFDKVSATIGTSQAFLIILPLDYSEGKQSLNSKIYWELSNYFPDSYDDYMINTYRLNSILPCRDTDEFLIIAVLKNTLEFLKRIFKLCNLNIDLIDIDHFAAEHSLRRNYEQELVDKNILLVGLKDFRIDYGYIENKKYRFYCYSKYYSEPEFNLSLARKINQLLIEKFSKTGIDKIYIYGDNVKDETLRMLNKNIQIPIKVINPFDNINSSTEFLKNEELRKTAHIFSPGCGVALRILESGIENYSRKIQKQED
jgi:Tfp pilus assembly PilM family ATPase